MFFDKKEGVKLCEVMVIGGSKADLEKLENYLSPYVFRKEQYFYLVSPETARAIEEMTGDICRVFISPVRLYPDPELIE